MSPRSRALAALVASLGLVAVAGVAGASLRSSGVGENLPRVTAVAAATEAPVAAPPVATPPVPVVDAGTMPAAVSRPAPARLDVASVGISMPVQPTGVQADGQMALPADPGVIGWYQFGALPGDPSGSAVLGGHVDSTELGTGPLVRLAGVLVGAEVVVTGGDGTAVRYEVTSVQRIQKAALPTDVLFAPDGPPQLAIVTCGGRYLPGAGGYEDNVVVLAVPVATAGVSS